MYYLHKIKFFLQPWYNVQVHIYLFNFYILCCSSLSLPRVILKFLANFMEWTSHKRVKVEITAIDPPKMMKGRKWSKSYGKCFVCLCTYIWNRAALFNTQKRQSVKYFLSKTFSHHFFFYNGFLLSHSKHRVVHFVYSVNDSVVPVPIVAKAMEQEQTKFYDLRRGITEDFQRLANFQRTLSKNTKKFTDFERFSFFTFFTFKWPQNSNLT